MRKRCENLINQRRDNQIKQTHEEWIQQWSEDQIILSVGIKSNKGMGIKSNKVVRIKSPIDPVSGRSAAYLKPSFEPNIYKDMRPCTLRPFTECTWAGSDVPKISSVLLLGAILYLRPLQGSY